MRRQAGDAVDSWSSRPQDRPSPRRRSACRDGCAGRAPGRGLQQRLRRPGDHGSGRHRGAGTARAQAVGDLRHLRGRVQRRASELAQDFRARHLLHHGRAGRQRGRKTCAADHPSPSRPLHARRPGAARGSAGRRSPEAAPVEDQVRGEGGWRVARPDAALPMRSWPIRREFSRSTMGFKARGVCGRSWVLLPLREKVAPDLIRGRMRGRKSCPT